MRIHLIPNSHIDPVWLWDKYEGLDEVLNTFRSACDRLDEYPNLTFAASSLQFYDWVRRYDMKLFQRIVQRVHEGRWEVAGGWWVETDTNLPTEKSFVKSARSRRSLPASTLAGKSAWPICPTLSAIQPHSQSCSPAAGFKYLVFCRPNEREKTDLPANLFQWEYDGHRILAYRLKHHYVQGTSPRSSFLPCGTLPNTRTIPLTASFSELATTAAGQASPKSRIATALSIVDRPATSVSRRACVSSTKPQRRRTFRSIAEN